jgi:hypothetical protein
MSATAAPAERSLPARAGRALHGWWFTPLPMARVAVLRAIVYLFVVYDVFYVANDVIPHAYTPDLYQPTLLARLLQIPTLSVEVSHGLRIVIVVACLLALWPRLSRAAGWGVFASFWLWMLNSQGFSYVSHDHMALMITVLVLPTVPAAGYGDSRTSESAGWALRCVQLSVVLTYFGSVFSKWARSGSLISWANGSIFTWAILRRGTDLIRWTLDYPMLLRAGQWGLLALEALSPLALFLTRWRLYVFIGFFLVFHLSTYLAIGIHFLPTVVCWAAFLPLERLIPAKR